MKKFRINGIDYKCNKRFKFAAVDDSGRCFVYTSKPKPDYQYGEWSNGGEIEVACVIDSKKRYWDKTLTKL